LGSEQRRWGERREGAGAHSRPDPAGEEASARDGSSLGNVVAVYRLSLFERSLLLVLKLRQR
jgi:hypothetical protein